MCWIIGLGQPAIVDRTPIVLGKLLCLMYSLRDRLLDAWPRPCVVYLHEFDTDTRVQMTVAHVCFRTT